MSDEVASALPEINVKSAWLDIEGYPDDKTGIRRLRVVLRLNGGEREDILFDQYVNEGVTLHGHNLTWMLAPLIAENERLKLALSNAREQLALMADGEGPDVEVYMQMSRTAVRGIDAILSDKGAG